jgi:hypothetical protein
VNRSPLRGERERVKERDKEYGRQFVGARQWCPNLDVVFCSRHTPCAVTRPANGTRSVPATKLGHYRARQCK